ncbi:MAG TPA: cation transporter [Candidatus Melainabacteria bacterium]|jgi:cation transport regulator|nr:cation transporter [Candidatus Melainabacteria bacterium]
MPYLSIDDLPPPVRNNLPRHAQKIFKDAFNSSYKIHHDEDEVTSFKIAWAAVKKKYTKQNGKWVKKSAA